MTRQPPGEPGLRNPFGLLVEHIGSPVPGEAPALAHYVWRAGELAGRVVDLTPYAREGTTNPGDRHFEPQPAEGDGFASGPAFSSLMDALEFLA